MQGEVETKSHHDKKKLKKIKNLVKGLFHPGTGMFISSWIN